MPSAGAILVALVLLVLSLIAGVIGVEMLVFGGKVLRDGYRALAWQDTDISDGFVKTTTTLRDGSGNNGFFRKEAPIVYAEASTRNMFNILKDTAVEKTAVELPAIHGAILKRDLQKVALRQPESEGRFDVLTNDWTVKERYGDASELPQNIQRGLVDLDRNTGFLKSVEVLEYRAEKGDTVRLLGLSSIEGVSSPKKLRPDGRFLLGVNVSWRRMALNRVAESAFSVLIGLALVVVAGSLLVASGGVVL